MFADDCLPCLQNPNKRMIAPSYSIAKSEDRGGTASLLDSNVLNQLIGEAVEFKTIVVSLSYKRGRLQSFGTWLPTKCYIRILRVLTRVCVVCTLPVKIREIFKPCYWFRWNSMLYPLIL